MIQMATCYDILTVGQIMLLQIELNVCLDYFDKVCRYFKFLATELCFKDTAQLLENNQMKPSKSFENELKTFFKPSSLKESIC